jgi:hypothetical protein
MIGLSLLRAISFPLPLGQTVLKCLLGKEVTMGDIEMDDPELFQSKVCLFFVYFSFFILLFFFPYFPSLFTLSFSLSLTYSLTLSLSLSLSPFIFLILSPLSLYLSLSLSLSIYFFIFFSLRSFVELQRQIWIQRKGKDLG